jgi:hypothetical protein
MEHHVEVGVHRFLHVTEEADGSRPRALCQDGGQRNARVL